MIRINSKVQRIGVLALVVVLLILTPQFLSENILGVIIHIMTLALFAMAFNVLWGYTGLLSFGHAAFYGSGAYFMVLLLNGPLPGLPEVDVFVVAFAFALFATIVVTIVVGVISTLRSGLIFAMITLAFNMVLFELADSLTNITGGQDGQRYPIGVEIELGITSFDVFNTEMLYYFTLLIFLVSIYSLWRVVNSPYGELLTAIRENPERAKFVGVPVQRYQISAFVISGAFTAVAGVLAALRQFVVSPDILHWSVSAEPVLATLIGGAYTFLGPVVGALVFVLLEEFLLRFTAHWHIVLGLILIPIVLFTPDGILGTLVQWRDAE
jgi:branched-chain amino acid transport system permease protein